MRKTSLHITRICISCLVRLSVCVFPYVVPRTIQFSVMGTSIVTLLLGFVETKAPKHLLCAYVFRRLITFTVFQKPRIQSKKIIIFIDFVNIVSWSVEITDRKLEEPKLVKQLTSNSAYRMDSNVLLGEIVFLTNSHFYLLYHHHH